ncbi:di-trans,poly-cis-decaprenylcistransferase [Candidatus Roizmanbacteria bacterium]|nr:di-trans,poly-cis-decaprenylcistransferase [Candidatus Roizmanbacteria bacterium]
MRIPLHLAVIPDGNRRWARARGLPTLEGHRRGFNALSKVAEKARELGVKIFTVWAFSTDNWQRSKKEVSYLMHIYEEFIDKNLKTALKDKIKIVHIGRKDRIPKTLQKKLNDAQEKTASFTKHYFVLALDYGGRDELLRAIQKIRNPKSEIRNLAEESFGRLLDTKDLPQPEPDLIVRTSGEHRLSGFMLWQSAYSELYFEEKKLPDVTEKDLIKWIGEYNRRKRRFGK